MGIKVGVFGMVGVVLIHVSIASAYDYGWDAGKVQYSDYYMELAQDPTPVIENGTPGWEYVIDMYDNGEYVTGTTYEIRGFENDHILNAEMGVYVPRLEATFDNMIMQYWDEAPAYGDATFLPASIETNADDVWELTGESWAMDNPWHVPSEYYTGTFPGVMFMHADSLVDAGDIYYVDPAPGDLISIRNWSRISPRFTGLVYSLRVVSTDLHAFGDITWTPWNETNNEQVVLGNWVPEPGSMTLLGLGSLAVLRRRSKIPKGKK